MTQTLSESDGAEIERLLLGRRIVAAEQGTFERPGSDGGWSYGDTPTGRLTLDDGTQVLVAPNQGGCACSAGDYELTHLARVDNVITSVRVAEESVGEDQWEPDTHYKIFVVADAVEINAVTIEGNDGNGYYGTGYELIVLPPAEATR